MNAWSAILLYGFIGLCALWVYWVIGVTIAMTLNAPEWVGFLLVPVFLGLCALVGYGVMVFVT